MNFCDCVYDDEENKALQSISDSTSDCNTAFKNEALSRCKLDTDAKNIECCQRNWSDIHNILGDENCKDVATSSRCYDINWLEDEDEDVVEKIDTLLVDGHDAAKMCSPVADNTKSSCPTDVQRCCNNKCNNLPNCTETCFADLYTGCVKIDRPIDFIDNNKKDDDLVPQPDPPIPNPIVTEPDPVVRKVDKVDPTFFSIVNVIIILLFLFGSVLLGYYLLVMKRKQ
jgi:hypothetical protein